MDKETLTELTKDRERLSKLENVLGMGKWLLTVCVTATSTFIVVLWQFGHWLYNNFDAFRAAIKAFLQAGGR